MTSTNDAILYQVALKAAAEIMAADISRGRLYEKIPAALNAMTLDIYMAGKKVLTGITTENE